MNDNVNHPSHYTDGKIEVIDFIEDKKLNYHLGNAVKYISRAGKKDPDKYIEDLQKAVWYLQREIDRRWPKALGIPDDLASFSCDDFKGTIPLDDPRILDMSRGTKSGFKTPAPRREYQLKVLLQHGQAPADGSEFEIELTDGTKIVLQYGTDKKGNKFLVFKDPMWREQMNEDWQKPNYWRDTDLRAKCNGEYYDLLPDWLKPYVLETTNVQVRDGERVETVDKLFPLSLSQVFPEEYLKWLCDGETTLIDSEPEDTLISLFEDPRNRVKFMWDDERKMMRAYSWFLRSSHYNDYYGFTGVYYDGSYGYLICNNTYGVVLGFRVR